MMRIYKIILPFIMVIFSITSLFAQSSGIDMADGLRSSGKIYVVVVSLLLILIGVLIYLFLMDKRISRVEKELKKQR